VPFRCFQGAYIQEYTLVYADLAAKLPPTMSTLEAASIPLALATAAQGYAIPFPSEGRGGAGLKGFWEDDAKGYYSGKPMLVLGGASAKPFYPAIQIASYMGFSPLITTCSLKNADFVKSIGATHVIDRRLEPAALKDEVQRIAGVPFDVVYDAVHVPITQAEVDFLAPDGIIVSIWELEEELLLKDGRKAVVSNGSVHLNKEQGRKMYAQLPHFLATGVIKVCGSKLSSLHEG